jgi:hypothetical protein
MRRHAVVAVVLETDRQRDDLALDPGQFAVCERLA